MIIRLNHPAELKVDQCHKSGDIWFGKVKGDSSIDPLLTGSHKHFIIGAIRLFGFSYLWRPPLPWHFNGRRAQLKPSIYEPGDKIFHPRTQSPFNIHPSSFFGGRENMFPCFVIFLVRWILIYLFIYLFNVDWTDQLVKMADSTVLAAQVNWNIPVMGRWEQWWKVVGNKLQHE